MDQISDMKDALASEAYRRERRARAHPNSAIWLRAPHNLELKFWSSAGSMAAADAALYEREGKPDRAYSSWSRALPLAGDARTKDFILGRLKSLTPT